MQLNLYNTLTRKKALFEPLDKQNVRMYVCGPTVYDYAHIGNARPVVVFDVLARLLRYTYGDKNVTYVRNITDIDDKIIEAQKKSGESIEKITSRTIDAFHSDMKALGNNDPDFEPRATEHITEMKSLIEDLLKMGHAYVKDGHVMFSVKSMPHYGRLSQLNKEQLLAGARVEVAPYKNDPEDFILWKPSQDEEPGWFASWEQQRVRGRPGWHMECSAMSQKYLGHTFDIHGGGLDLVFPHHENEIAQSQCVNGPDSFAKVWMHNGYLMVEGEKMSKSHGNYITVHELLDKHHGEAIRLCLLMTHYRQPLNWTKENLTLAKETLNRWYGALRLAQTTPKTNYISPNITNALLDDLNTPLAIATMHELTSDIYKNPTTEAKSALLAAGDILGILQQNPTKWFRWQPDSQDTALSDSKIDELISTRQRARQNNDFAAADKIRDELVNHNIILEDTPTGTLWKRI
ncbi:MAG: cysteine--tRNA ligase [Pseudomonadota bacterium]|nr:cysteine--tRNA ligase [Pseudomonadota bacterium]